MEQECSFKEGVIRGVGMLALFILYAADFHVFDKGVDFDFILGGSFS